jgi:hypothetical protein
VIKKRFFFLPYFFSRFSRGSNRADSSLKN